MEEQGLASLSISIKLSKVYERTMFETLDRRQQRIATSEIWGMKEANSIILKRTARREFPGINVGGWGWGHSRLPGLRSSKSERTKWLELAEQSSREEKVAKREDSGDL